MSAADRVTEPLKHIERSGLPWQRGGKRVECGRDANDVAAWVTRDEAVALWTRLGKQRAAFILCMTCVSTVNRHPTWNDNPSAAMQRECNGTTWTRNETLDRDLCAIAALIEAHREDFDAYVEGLEATIDIAELRANKRRRA